MNRAIHSGIYLIILLGLVWLPGVGFSQTHREPSPPPDGKPSPSPDTEAKKAIETAIVLETQNRDEVLAYQIFDLHVDPIQISADGRWATGLMHLVDRQSLARVPSEPGLAIAEWVDDTWSIALPGDPHWPPALRLLPDELLDRDAQTGWEQRYLAQVQAPQEGPYGGYLLPWAAGLEKFLTRSISHGVGGSMHYAFDFAEPGYPSDMFPIYAAKGGVVKYVVWSYPNGYYDGNCNHTNYLVLQHDDTTPTTYTLYMHLAHESIPVALREVGASVHQGEYIGYADNTGCSSGNHLHLQVHTNPWSYWGSSVDIIFFDVPINGGRPRTPEEAAAYPAYGDQGQSLYLSANTVWNESIPPSGQILSPPPKSTLGTPVIQVSGSAFDGQSGLSHYHLKALYDNAWHDLGPSYSWSTFNYTWDMCAAGVPDGPIALALEIFDQQGNVAPLAGLDHYVKNYVCPAPAPLCTPGPDEVSLFSESNFLGACQTLEPGDYPNSASFALIGDNNVESLRVGNDVLVTLFSEAGFLGRSRTLSGQDRNFRDNPVGPDTLSSLKIRAATTPPTIPSLLEPASNSTFTEPTSLTFSWRDGAAGQEYQWRLNGTAQVTSDWQFSTALLPGSLASGSYTWQVRARNPAGESAWSSPRPFTVTSTTATSPTIQGVPYLEDFESGATGWQASGLWHLSNDGEHAHSGNHGFWYGSATSGSYQTASANAGDLTSPEIQIPAGGATASFWYRYDTEGPTHHWDQRWVQISMNGGPFRPLLQLKDDEPHVWLQSPAIDLNPYAGQAIRLRLHFATLDTHSNQGQGWEIDDFQINSETTLMCNDPAEPNNQPSQATMSNFGATTSGDICPAGDLDVFSFQALSGQRVALDVDAQALGSALDSYLYLLDTDGETVLASHDDEVLYERRDSHLGYTLPETGTYFLKLKAWDHPGAGGEDYFYTLTLRSDHEDPAVTLQTPSSEDILAGDQVPVVAAVSDASSGISHVEFWWHDGDWSMEDWALLDDDWDGQDGWQTTFNADGQPEQSGIAIYARAYDWAGNEHGRGAWELQIDRSPPDSALQPLPPVETSSAIQLRWNASDNVSGLAYFDLQFRQDLGAWQDAQTSISGQARSAWFVGQPGSLYEFRLRAVDKAGNVEPYPASSEAVTLIEGCTSPDAFEPDDNPAQANPLSSDGALQTHTLCQLGDQDWLALPTIAGTHYRVMATPGHPSSAVAITLFSPDGSTQLKEAQASGFGQWTLLEWTASESGTHLLQIRHINDQVAGDGVSYLVWAWHGYGQNLPAVPR